MKFGRYEEKEIDEPFYRARANRQKRVRFFFCSENRPKFMARFSKKNGRLGPKLDSKSATLSIQSKKKKKRPIINYSSTAPSPPLPPLESKDDAVTSSCSFLKRTPFRFQKKSLFNTKRNY